MVNSADSSTNPIVPGRWLRFGNALSAAVISLPYAFAFAVACAVALTAGLMVLGLVAALIVFGAVWALAVFAVLVTPVLAVGALLPRERRVALGLWLRDQVRLAAEGPGWWRRLTERGEKKADGEIS